MKSQQKLMLIVYCLLHNKNCRFGWTTLSFITTRNRGGNVIMGFFEVVVAVKICFYATEKNVG